MATQQTPPQTLQAFNTYPWASDREFMQSLVTTLGPLLSPQSLSSPFTKPQVLTSIQTLRAKYYTAKFNVPISPSPSSATTLPTPDEEILKKASWLYVNIQKKINNNTPVPPAEGPKEEEVPEWQRSGGVKVDLSKKAEDGEGEVEGEDRKGEYPNKFQAIIEAVTTGKTIEGIREIEERIVRGEGVVPVGGGGCRLSLGRGGEFWGMGLGRMGA
ncbi:hypothetical protein QC762_0092200 [Podospora pseudocomata]|uniref:Mediator complex subunit 8 n=1 Tax=Podospora pseudocomata TaxID=2093779 RepID=A0ABR0G6P7_9PEZI|nr:hypothetical protein QC762_0092200 [Podospora pseudocomata]